MTSSAATSKKKGRGASAPWLGSVQVVSTRGRVRDDSRNIAARTVPRQYFGTVAKLHFAPARAAMRPELAQKIFASGVLEDKLCFCRWVRRISRLGAHYGNVLTIGVLKPYERLCIEGRAR